MTVESKPAADASIGELLSQLSAQTSRLVRDELRLAQKEFQQSAKHAGIGAGLFSVAGLLAFLGLVTLIGAAVAALSLVLPVWAAAVIVAAVLFLVAGVAALIGSTSGRRGHSGSTPDGRNGESRHRGSEGSTPWPHLIPTAPSRVPTRASKTSRPTLEQTRNELGQTVEALADKLDVKGRAKEKAAETKEQVVEKADALRHTVTDNPKRTVPIAAVALIAALAVGIVVWRRRH